MKALFSTKPARSFPITILLALGALPTSLALAQTDKTDPPYSIVDRGPFYRVLQRTVSLTNAVTGEVSQQVQSYTDLEDGMNYLSNGQWVEAQDLIEVTSTGAQAVHGQMAGKFSNDITSAGAITLSTPTETFQSHPIGLFYSDSASGKVAQLGSVQTSVGTLYPPNVIVFSNVLSGLRADLMLVWAKNGFEQNLVLKQNPPPPESFSMSSSTTTLQLWTAMDECPLPQEQRPVLLSSGLEDHILIFGSTWFPVGAAFAFGNTALPPTGQAAQVSLIRPSDPGTVPVAKSLANISGQEVLIEEVRYTDLAQVLSQLPQASLTPKVHQTVELADRGEFLRHAQKSSSASRPIQVALTQYVTKGVVLDYPELSGNVNTYTFTNGSTYHIAVQFEVGPGAAYLQANAVVKLDTNAYCLLYGNVSCSTSGSPTVFTSSDDDDFGIPITTSTHNPGYAASEGIWMYYQTNQTTLQDIRVRWAQSAIRYDQSASNLQPQLNTASLEHSTTGIFLNIGADTLYLTSATSCNVTTAIYNFKGQSHTSGNVTLNCGDTPFVLAGNDLQHESTATINPSDPTKVAIFAADYGTNYGLMKVTSSDRGNTWNPPVLMATGPSGDGLPTALSDVQAAYDAVGNLFLCYTTSNNASIVLAKSRDNGTNWNIVKTFTNSVQYVDRPVVATGPGGTYATSSVWVLYDDGSHLTLAGAAVASDGTVSTNFTSYVPGCSTVVPPNGPPVSTGLAIGPTGKVAMAYESQDYQNPLGRYIYINMDTDGLGPNQATNGCTAQIQVNMEWSHYIPAQPDRHIFRVPVLAWDRGSTSHSNRIYLAFADTQTTSTNDYDTDVYVMYSDTECATWSQHQRENDDATTNSQFFPGIAVDQTTGLIAVSWYDCRNDSGNTNTQFFATVSRDGFTTAKPKNFQLTTNSSYSHQPTCPTGTPDVLNYGDYTGLAFYGGYSFPSWCSFAGDVCGDVHTCRIPW